MKPMDNEVKINDVPTALRMGDVAPNFEARTTAGHVRLADYRGSWLVFFSHPADFTPVCTSEFIAFAQTSDEFAEMGCALLGLSVDSLYSHIAWAKAIDEQFGVKIPFPIVEDPSMTIAKAYGMIDAHAHSSVTVRATYIIDPAGIVQAILQYPNNVGRSVKEILRTVAALQATADGQHNTPAEWQMGEDLLLPSSLDIDHDDWFCRKAP